MACTEHVYFYLYVSHMIVKFSTLVVCVLAITDSFVIIHKFIAFFHFSAYVFSYI
jgi:hypothetical protein